MEAKCDTRKPDKATGTSWRSRADRNRRAVRRRLRRSSEWPVRPQAQDLVARADDYDDVSVVAPKADLLHNFSETLNIGLFGQRFLSRGGGTQIHSWQVTVLTFTHRHLTSFFLVHSVRFLNNHDHLS